MLFRMALSDFIVDYRPFTKQKGLHQVSVLNTWCSPRCGHCSAAMRDADGFLVHSFLPTAGNIYIKKCRQGKHRAQFSAMPSTTGTDYKNNNVCLYSIKIIYKIIIILYLVVVNGGFCMGSCTMITMCLQLYSHRSIIAIRRWSDEKDDLSRLGSHY